MGNPKSDAMHALLAKIEEVRWHDGGFVEFRFSETFDGSFVFAEDGGRIVATHRGRDRDAIVILEHGFCVCFGKDDAVLDGRLVFAFQEEYRREQGGKSSGNNWIRMAIPDGTVFLYLCLPVRDDGGELRCPGRSFFRPGT